MGVNATGSPVSAANLLLLAAPSPCSNLPCASSPLSTSTASIRNGYLWLV